MKQVIYSEHHRGIVEYPLHEKPKWEDYQLGRNSKEYEEDLQGMKPSWQSIFNDNYHTKLAVYVKWLSSPPIAQVPKEFIEFFSVPKGESEYEIKDVEDYVGACGHSAYPTFTKTAFPIKLELINQIGRCM